jgi:hypothetical protein
MKILRARARAAETRQRGAALLLSLLILLVLVAIVIQINVSTGTEARVTRNEVGLTSMDLAVESALLQVYDKLKSDAESGGADAGAAGAGQTPAQNPASPSDPNNPTNPPAGGGSPAGGAQACDSRRDDWATPQRTEINEIKLRIVIQDEDSKYNILNMLNADATQAQAAFDRVVKILDLCREGTTADIDSATASQMAKAMLEYMQQRKIAKFPRPTLLSDSDDPNKNDQGLPLSLKEFAVLAPFDDSHFRDFRDENDKIVHSIGSFLTVWSSVGLASDKKSATTPASNTSPNAASTKAPGGTTGGSGGTPSGGGSSPSSTTVPTQVSGNSGTFVTSSGGSTPSASGGAQPGSTPGGGTGGGAKKSNDAGGFAVNVNTAPPAVLKSLFDDRELNPRFWDKVIEYRNLEDEDEAKKAQDSASTETEPPALDEYGNPVIKRKIFDTMSKLGEVDGYKDLDATIQARVNQLLTNQSHVFSIYVIARRTTSVEGDMSDTVTDPKQRRLAEQKGDSLVRVVRSVVWRHKTDSGYEIVPIVRWEVLDYEPWEVLDYPDENR